MTTIALFDIDGTLLRAGGAGRRSVELALAELIGRDPEETSLASVDFAGRTDPWIIAQALEQYGVPIRDALIDQVLARYVEHLPGELEKTTRFEVLPGVRALLSALVDQLGLALGIGTGNVQRGAYTKLRHAGIDRYFAFGGFGCDHADRGMVLRKGRERGLQHHGVADARVIVVGDTPHDVVAAHAIGAYAIAVCTGWFDHAALREAGADLVVDDLRDDRVRAALADS